MDARGSGLGAWGLGDLRRLQPSLFRTPAERSQLQTAVHQVFGSHAWHGCCSDKLLETLLEAGQRCYLKQQLYWDFQLLDADRDGCLSSRDAELLLSQVPHAHPAGEAWQDFLRSRGPSISWRDIEDWLFRPPPLLVDRPHTELRRRCFSEQGASGRGSSPLCRWGIRRWDEQPLERWDSGGLSTLIGEEPTGVLAALERKYWVLQRKLCAEMLQAHYGHPVWTSLSQAAKEDKLSELETLVDFGLRDGSILPLSSLPGAQHDVRYGAELLKAVNTNVGPLNPSTTEGTAAHALLQLRRRRQAETAALLTHRHLLGCSNPETSRQLLHLHAQAELIQKEASFQAALLAIELFLGEGFWDSQPIEPGACHLELARLRLAAGYGPESAWQEAKSAPGRSMAQVLLDRLLLQQERDRSCLIQVLLALAKSEGTHERGRSRKQPGPMAAERVREDPSPALQEAISQMLKRKEPEGASKAEATWQDGAVTVLADLQREQQEELSHTIESLAGIPSDREGAACPALYEKLLARLQEAPLTSLVRDLQPVPPQEQPRPLLQQENLQTDRELPLAQEPSLTEGESFAEDEMPQREDDPLLREPETSPHKKLEGFPGGRYSEAPQASIAPGDNQNLPQDKEIQAEQGPLLQKLSPDTLEAQVGLLRKSKSLGSLEFLMSQASPQGLRGAEIPQQTPHGGLETPHLPGAQMEAVDTQTHGDLQYIPQRETEALQENGKRETLDLEPQRTPLVSEKQADPQSEGCVKAFRTQGTQFPESPDWRESEAHRDVHKESLVLQDSETRPVKTQCEQDLRFPEASQLQGFLWKKSKSLEPQLLSRARTWGSPQIQQEVCQPQECGYPQALQPQEGEAEGTSQEGLRSHDLRVGLQCQKFPESHQALIQVPEPLSHDSEKMARLRGVRQPEDLHIPGAPQGRPQDGLQQEQELTQAEEMPLEKTEETTQGQRGPELSHPETPPHYKILSRKSKSLELRSPAFQSQELREPQGPGTQPLHPQMGAEALQAQGTWKPEGFEHKKARKDPQSHPPEEVLLREQGRFQGQEVAQKGARVTRPQNVKETQAFSSEGAKGAGNPQRQTWVPQSPECRSPESPPLLWRVMWQKAKTFELRKKDLFPRSGLQPEASKPSIFYHQKMKEPKAPQSQAEKDSQMEKWMPTDLQACQHLRERTSETPQEALAGQSDVLTQGQRQEMPQEMRERETRLVEKSPQKSQHLLQSEEISQRELGQPRYLGESQPCNKQTQETVPQKEMWGPQSQEGQKPESPPLLWGALELKSKSFEMRKSEEHKLRKSLMGLSQRRPPVGPEAHRPQGWKVPDTLSPQELRETKASQTEEENEALSAQRVQPERLHAPALRERGTFPGQDTRDLETHQAQGTQLKKATASESHEVQQQRELDPSEDPRTVSPPLLWRVLGLKAKSFELRRPRPFQTQDVSHLKPSSLAQSMPQKELRPSQMERMPQRKFHTEQQPHELQEHRGPKIHHPPALREEEAPQIQTEKELSYGQQGQIMSQSPKILKEPRRSQATQTDGRKDGMQSGPEVDIGLPQHQKRSSPETPPFLWWALELAQQGTQHGNLLDSPQLQETEMPPAAQLQGRTQTEAEAQKSKEHVRQKSVHPQEPKEPESPQELEEEKRAPKSPQPEVESQGLESQSLQRAKATQTPRKIPQAHDARKLQETGPAPVQKSPLTTKGPQDAKRSSKKQDKQEISLSQGKASKMCDSYKVGCCHVHPSQELQGGADSRQLPSTSLQVQGMLGCDTKDCGPSDESQELRLERAEVLEMVEHTGCPAPEGHSRAEGLLPPGRLIGKSKSLDPRDLRTQKSEKLRQQESLQVQREPEARPTAFRVQEALQMKPQKEREHQALKSPEERGLHASEAQSTSQLPQSQGPSAESPSHLQSRLERASESHELMGTPESSPHRDPKNLKLQGTVDPKAPCPEGHCESPSCGVKMDDKHSEVTGTLERCSQTFLMQETFQLQATLLRKMLRDQEISQLQEKFGEKDPVATTDTQEDNQQLQGRKEKEPPGVPQMESNPLEVHRLLQRDLEGFGLPDPRQLHLQLKEKMSESVELMEDEMSPAELPLSYMETEDLSSWRGLGKSKSLDPRELQGEGLGDPSNLQDMGSPKACHPQSQGELGPQDFRGAVVLQSGTIQELPPKHIEDPQFQQEPEGETQKTEQVEMESPQVQGSLGPQEKRDVQSPPLLRNLLRKSKTFGHWIPMRGDGIVQRPESPHDQLVRETLQGLVGQKSPNSQGQSQSVLHQHQETVDIIEGTQGNLDSHREDFNMEVESIKSLPVNHDLLQEQGDETFSARQVNLSQSLPPHKAPPELLHSELEALQPQGLRSGEDQGPQENRDFGELGEEAANEPQTTLGLQFPQDWRGSGSHQPPPTDQEATEPRETQHGQQRIPQPPPSQKGVEGSCQPPGRRVRSPEMKAPQIIPGQECSPEASTEVPGATESQVLQPQESMEPQAGWGLLEAEGRLTQLEPAPAEPHNLELWGVLLGKSKSLDPQELTRTQDLEGTQGMRRAEEDPRSRDRELGAHQIPSSRELPQEALQLQSTFPKPQGPPKEWEARQPNTLLRQSRREPKGQRMDEHPQVEQGIRGHLPELKDMKLCQVCREQELQGEVLESQGMEGPQAFQSREQRETEAMSGEGPQLRMLSDPGMCYLDRGELESGALNRRPEASPPWEQAPNDTWKSTAMAMLSPPSPGGHDEEPVWTPAALGVGLSRESSISVVEPERPSGLSWDGKVDVSFTGSGISPFWVEPAAYCELDSATREMPGSSHSAEEEGEEQPPRPRPPCREKAFVWLSHQEKEAALRRLAELQAKGEWRHQRDKERQTLRFQERLSIAKHRKSEDGLLGSSPAELWPLPSDCEGQQDQAGQKTAVKRHLEKVKRERTYVMQSKRERNTLRFKELLNPLVAEGEEAPEPEQPGDV